MKSLEKDIILICKGWYNKEKYSSILEALNGYYHREYGCQDITMNKEFAIYLFLKPAYIEFGNIRHIFEPTWAEYGDGVPDKSFISILYERLIFGMVLINDNDTIDLSDYQDTFDKAKACDYKDFTIGII